MWISPKRETTALPGSSTCRFSTGGAGQAHSAVTFSPAQIKWTAPRIWVGPLQEHAHALDLEVVHVYRESGCARLPQVGPAQEDVDALGGPNCTGVSCRHPQGYCLSADQGIRHRLGCQRLGN